jgi:hypothetical protein
MLWCLSSAAKLKYKATDNTTDRNGEFRTMVGKIGPWHVDASGWLIICHPVPANNFASLETDFLSVFSRHRVGLENVFRSLAQISDNFRTNTFACRNLSLLAPYFLLCQWRVNALHTLAPGQLLDWPAPYSGPNGDFCLCHLQRVHRLLPGDHTVLWIPVSTASNPA